MEYNKNLVLIYVLFLPLVSNGVQHNSVNSLNHYDGECGSESRFEWPLITLGKKSYYIGHFFKTNWYKASHFCRFHQMHLASVESKAENELLEKSVQEFGLGQEHFWTSGTDLGEEGVFTWFGNGRPVSFTNWNAGEPNNFRYENGEEEHCLELWNRDGKGLKWNDTPCSFETYFICEK